MRILIVNDDGYSSEGIIKLAAALSRVHEVIVVAPHKCYSGYSHAMTFCKPMRLTKILSYEWKCYSLEGTPADCVKLGASLLRDCPPDLVLSGLNNDTNLGDEIHYSGTVNAAIEAATLGFPSIALSAKIENIDNFDTVINDFLKNFDYLTSITSSNAPISVNYPVHKAEAPYVYKLTCTGERKYTDDYTVTENDDGADYVLSGFPINSFSEKETDVYWFNRGYATITPLLIDNTNYAVLDYLIKSKPPRGEK